MCGLRLEERARGGKRGIFDWLDEEGLVRVDGWDRLKFA